jgi:hypothetical protein
MTLIERIVTHFNFEMIREADGHLGAGNAVRADHAKWSYQGLRIAYVENRYVAFLIIAIWASDT